MNLYFFIFEFGAIFAFLLLLYRERKNRRMVEILILAFVYGIILEAFNIYMSQQIYSYSPVFVMEIFGVPLAIGAGWAVIYYLSWSVAKRYNLAWWQSPFLMALIALSYDIAIDAVAIRLGFWSWKLPLNEEWFGVPYENFFGWLAVVWTFSLLINLSFQNFIKLKAQKIIRCSSLVISPLLLVVQIIIFENLSAILSDKFTFGEVVALYNLQERSYVYLPEVQATKGALFFVLILSLSFFCAVWIGKNKNKPRGELEKFPIMLSTSIHLMFLFFLIASGVYKDLPALLLISIATFGLNILLNYYPIGSVKIK